MDVNEALMGRRKRTSLDSEHAQKTKRRRKSLEGGKSGQATLAFPLKSRATVTAIRTNARKVEKKQSYIDLGQKSFGKSTICPNCGMLYTNGVEEDEKEHQSQCRLALRGISIPKWKTERRLESFMETKARIIEIKSSDAPAHVKKLHEIQVHLDDVFGACDDTDVLKNRRYFLYICKSQLVGCCTVESIQEAHVLDDTSSSRVQMSVKKVRAVIGINQLWVHPSFRRKSIASRLVDCIRKHYAYGMHLPKTALAFAQPTADGQSFAKHYMKPNPVLVYGDTI